MCDYRELPPPRPLAAHLVCLWTRTTGEREAELRPRVLPDGCIDIVWMGDAAPAVVGPATRAVRPSLPRRSTIVGARFRPGMAPSLLGLPASELLDAEVPLPDIWGREAAGRAVRAAELRTVEARLAAAEAALVDRLAVAGPSDKPVRAAVAWLIRHPAGRVGELSRWCGLSERQLLRRFEAAVGYGPKTLQRILRFRRWLHLASRMPNGRSGLAELAAVAGYADQAHLTREVARLAGVPPAALLADGAGAGPGSDSLSMNSGH